MEYDFKLRHIAGTRNGRADALSRRPDHNQGKDDNKQLVVLPAKLFTQSHARIAGSEEANPNDPKEWSRHRNRVGQLSMALSLLPPSSPALLSALPWVGACPPSPPGAVPMDIAPDGPLPAPGVVGKSGKPGNRGPAPASKDDSLSVFDVLNIFRRWWFLSRAALLEYCLSAQKAEDGSISWVEFSPPFHSHLVKCAVALVPHHACPVPMVKRVMFVFILELLNREGHLAFFNLQKGGRKANNAQKEKRCLARKRSRAAKREQECEAAKAAKLPPREQECLTCGRKFQSRKTAKRHKCARHSKVVRKKEEAATGPGLHLAPPAKPITLAAPITPLVPPAPSHSNAAPPVTGVLAAPLSTPPSCPTTSGWSRQRPKVMFQRACDTVPPPRGYR